MGDIFSPVSFYYDQLCAGHFVLLTLTDTSHFITVLSGAFNL